MRKERMNAVNEVRANFLTAEQVQDAAAIHSVRAVLTALEQRSAANLPIGTGLKALTHLGRAAQLSLEARNALIMAHPLLALLPEKLGVKMAGDVDPCPPLDGNGDVPDLRIVA